MQWSFTAFVSFVTHTYVYQIHISLGTFNGIFMGFFLRLCINVEKMPYFFLLRCLSFPIMSKNRYLIFFWSENFVVIKRILDEIYYKKFFFSTKYFFMKNFWENIYFMIFFFVVIVNNLIDFFFASAKFFQ